MLQKIKTFLSNNFKSRDNIVTVNTRFNNNSQEFDILLRNLNHYFKDNLIEKEIFKKEIQFLNSSFKTDPSIDKINYAILPYPFILDYDYHKIKVNRDEEAGMFYVYLDQKKMYYHKGFTNIEDVQKSFTFLSAEQHIDSPHRYLDNTFFVTHDDVVADVGAAEGNFSLMVVEKVKELIIVEADPIWTEALHKTFEPWKDKVRIINKFAGEYNDEKTITLDKLEKENKISVIKMDIEGAEIIVLDNAQAYLNANNIKMAITTYHRQTDAEDIKNLLEKKNYQTVFSEGFMLFVFDKLIPPYFRHGLIKAKNF
jgi:hypothetical protein